MEIGVFGFRLAKELTGRERGLKWHKEEILWEIRNILGGKGRGRAKDVIGVERERKASLMYFLCVK